MSIYYDKATARWRWQFQAVVDGTRHRHSKSLPRGWGEAQAKRFDEQETARQYARIAVGGRINVPLITTAVALYLTERVPMLKDGKHSAENLAHMLPWYSGKGLDVLGDVSRRYAREARTIKGERLEPATIRQRLATLRSAATYALRHHGIGSRDWIEQITMPTVSNARTVFLRRSEVLRLARQCHDPGTRALVLLTFATGARPGELHACERIGNTLTSETKNGDRITHPIMPRFRYLLRHWPMQFGYTYYSRHFRAARAAIGMDHVHLHDLRHSTASALLDAGHDLRKVGLVLGHRTAQATARYTHLYPEAQAQALESIFNKRRKA